MAPMTRRVENGLIGGAMVVAFVGGALSGNHPTGSDVADAVWGGALAAIVVLAATRARRWTWVVLAGAATVMASGPVWAACGVAALFIAVVASFVDVRGPVTGAVLAALSMQSVLRLSDFGFSRLSGLVAGAVCALMLLSGYGLARRRSRRIVRRSLLGAGILAAGIGLAAAAAVNDARSAADLGSNRTQAALKLVQEGDTQAAKLELDRAADAFAGGHATISSFWTLPARFVPGLGVQVAAADELAAVGTDITRTAGITVGSADYRSVRLEGGRIDVARLAAMTAPLEQAVGSLRDGRTRAARLGSPWLLPWVAHEADRLTDQIDRVLPATELAVDATRHVPGLLGAGGPKRYLVLFAQPAEARGLGGFVGGYGELVATDGKVELTRSGPIEELSEHAGRNQRTLSGPQEFLDRYGRFRPTRFLQNVTASPDLPTVLTVLRELYPQAGGDEIDGVIYADPAGLAALLGLTGPVKVPGLDQRLTADNAASFLLRDQYVQVEESSTRDQMLTGVGKATFDALLRAKTPGPERIGRVLGPAVAGGHLLFSVTDADTQGFFGRVGLSGAFPAPRGQDWFSVRVFNGNGNKIDAYLKRSVSYDVTYEPATGTVRATATIGMQNTSPTEGLPSRVIGNENGDPVGTNRLYLSLHTPLRLVSADLGGVAAAMEPQQEFGGSVYSLPVVLPPGASVQLTATLEGTIAVGAGYRLSLSPQALPAPDAMVVTVRARAAGGVTLPFASLGGAQERDGVARREETTDRLVVVDAQFGAG